MDADAAIFVKRLRAINPEPGDQSVVETLYQLTDFGETLKDPKSVFPAVFEFFEKHADAELGEPGPLIHFVERTFPGGFEGLLVKSLERKPTRYTLWMANRLLNSSEITVFLRSRLMEALRLAATEANGVESTRDLASQYLSFQLSKQ